MLTGEVSMEMIRKFLFGMAADKSPGPDGFSSEFFSRNLDYYWWRFRPSGAIFL